MTTRVMNTAEKKEQIIPMISVMAKPLTGPCPSVKRMNPTIMVVTLASMMEE